MRSTPILPKRAIQTGVYACILICMAIACLLKGAAQQSTRATTPAKSGTKASNPAPPRNTEAGGRYVGSKVCASCHSNIYGSFRQTSMGTSMLRGDANSLASLLPVPATVYDKDSNQYFDVTRKDGRLFQSQYALDADGKELFRQTWKVDYDIGAGANGFGFLIQRDHYLFEAPLSYYTQTHSWGFAPGFEIQNRGFTRPILGRCITCHSGRPNPVAGQVGLYKDPPFDELAVGCENCHGPGELHVAERAQDLMTGAAPSGSADASIVNPARLSGWLADNICMRCHQGQDVRIEVPGKNLQDFRPGMPLGDYVSIFKIAPEAGASPSALPLEHYFGMTLSKCYRASRNLHCITCHDPHVESSAAKAFANYRSQCLRCHTQQSCRLEPAKRLATNPPDDCLTCHMPKRTVTTIAHAALTDHSIPRQANSTLQPPDQSHRNQKPELLVLSAPLDEWKQLQSVPPVVLLEAYDNLVREGRHGFYPLLTQLLQQVSRSAPSNPVVLRVLARAEFRKDTPAASLRAIDYMKKLFGTTLPNIDDYLFLGDLYTRTQQEEKAVKILEKARSSSPYFREVYEMLASDYMTLGQYGDALAVLRQGIELFPDDSKLRALKIRADSVSLGPLQ
jgi:tetratricopeptide (TPR) repeat protein